MKTLPEIRHPSLRPHLITLGLIGAMMGALPAQARTSFKPLRARPNGTVTAMDYLQRGTSLELDWASTSSMGCWPSPRNEHFNGKHVLFTAQLPRRSVMTIEVIPLGRSLDLSLYAYAVAKSRRPPLPPNVAGAVSCASSHLRGVKRRSTTTNPGAPEKVRLNATTNPYTVVIGVTGAHGASSGRFKLKITLRSGRGGVTNTGPPPLEKLQAKANDTVEVSGSIDAGKRIPQRWASLSSMACWPATQNEHFSGKHVLYLTKLPRRSVMHVELIPARDDLDLSLYAYAIGTRGRPRLPPRVRGAVGCEASYLRGIRKRSITTNPGGTEKVRLNAIRNPYRVVIGVAGAHGAKAGAFKLRIHLKTAGGGVPDTGPPPLEKLQAKANDTVEVSGSIDAGKRIPQRWASLSSMACWPATQNEHFSGKHVLYLTKLPRRSVMHVELIPARDDLDLSLYAYAIGTRGRPRLPPRVRGAVGCEASYLRGIRKRSITTNPGGTEKVRLNAIRNPYRVVIGVAGAHGAKAGAFKLRVHLKTAGRRVRYSGPPPLQRFEAKANDTVEVSGSIDAGKRIPQRWASRSSMACWPATQNEHFSGKHVLYMTRLPRRSVMHVKLIPSRDDLDLSLYAYLIGTRGRPRLPPRVYGSVGCEASYLYGIRRRSVTSNPGGTEKVRLNAARNSYRVVIGVAGAHGAKAGDFTLQVKTRSGR